MFLKIYELITELQDEIGDGAEVSLFAREGKLEIRVDWWDIDFHVRHQSTEIELAKVVDYSLPMKYLVAWCKHEYSRAVRKGT